MPRFNTEAMTQSFQDASKSRRSTDDPTEGPRKKAAPKRTTPGAGTAAGTRAPRPRKATPQAAQAQEPAAAAAPGPVGTSTPRAELLARRGEKELTVRLPNQLLAAMSELQFRMYEQDGTELQRERIIADALAALPKDDARTLALACKVPRGSGGLRKVALTLPTADVNRAQLLSRGSVLSDNGGVKVTVTAIITAALESYLPKVRKKLGL